MSSSSKQLDIADMSFVDYVDSLRIPYEKIELATSNFTDANLLPTQSPSSSSFPKLIYRGQLEQSGGQVLDIVARKIPKEQDNVVFNELVTSYLLKHKNIHSIFKICDTDEPTIIISKYEANGSLDKHLSDSTLTWIERLHICVGVAHALSYIHDYDAQGDFSVMHGNVKSSKILLDENLEPKLNCFGFSMFIKKHQPHLTSKYNRTIQYTDPAYVNPGGLNHKSDVFSFGVVLFEVLFGEIASVKDEDNWYFARLARSLYEKKTLDDRINTDLHKQMDLQSLDTFSEIAYYCLEEESSRRPNMVQIVKKLEASLELQQNHQSLMNFQSNTDDAPMKVNIVVDHAPTAMETKIMSKEFAHLRIPLENILSATNSFSEKNRIRTSGFAKEYEGQLSWFGELIDITARRLNKERDNDDEHQFWMEIAMLSSLRHKNLVSFVGFCDENGEKIIINRREVRGSLGNYLSNPRLLTWVQRLEICVGVANALCYIYYDEQRDFSVIHRNIESNTVVLNDDWEPRLSNFEFSIKIKASQRHHSFHTNKLEYVNGYGDPTYIETKSVSHKSDIYSFGTILFELLCGRKSIIDDDQDNKYLGPVAIFHYKEKILDELIDWDLMRQMDPRSFSVFAETAYACLNKERSRRPNIHEIVTRLESALKLQMERQNDEHSIVAAKVEDTSSDHDKGSLTSISTQVEFHDSKETNSFLDDLSRLKLGFQDIISATNNFADENIIEKIKLGIIYKGRLLHSEQIIDITVKRFYTDCIKDESRKIWTEISMLSSLKHKNLVSLIGFSDDEYNKMIIYKKEANESLAKHLGDQTLTWMQRLKICVGVANALSYIYYDVERDFSVIHCNIGSSKILLDDKWEPKLSGFELSLKNTVARRHRLLLTRDIVKNVYLDPKYEKTGGVTHKSDVYSFGVVLFEVLCARSADEDEDKDENGNEDEDEDKDESEDKLGEGLLRQLAKSHLEDMIEPHLRKQMDPEALKIFSETAYLCIKEERADRPHIDQVINRLEKALKLQSMYENPELPRNAVDSISSNHLRWKNLEHLKIGLNDIEMATEKFADEYCIGSDEYGRVYMAQLEHFDSSNSSSIEGKNNYDLPKKRSTVAIKRSHNREEEQGLIAEIQILTSCKHENIISLLGFCDEDRDHMILVYELSSIKGSLEDYLGYSDKMTNLSWMQRLKICLDIAYGLKYIHTNTDKDKQKIIHHDIKSANILLGNNWKAKIANFGFLKFHPAEQDASTFYVSTIAGTYMYLDPEYEKYGRLNKNSDIYSFGVVLLEILTGRLAYDSIFTEVNEKGIAPIARHHFEKGTLMEIVDYKIKEETIEPVFSLSKGPNKESLDRFSKIAFRCLAETQAERPSIDVVINELKKALDFQENHKDSLKLSLQDIKLATNTFNQENLIGRGDFGNVYKGHTHGHNFIAAKRLGRKSAEGEAEFVTELEILMEYKHENVIGLVGYCDEEDEKIIVYEYASRRSLDQYVSNDSLTWVMRLKICIDIAVGLEFLHGTDSSPEMVIHRDIRSSNILLLDDWKAKISDFGLSLVCPTNQDVDYVIDNVTGTNGYSDPLYSKTSFLTKESDIFSLGAVLFDILCGKLSSEKLDDQYLYLPFLAKQHYQLEKLDELVFEGIKEEIGQQSFITFARIAYQCVHHRRERRPTVSEVVIQLKKALEFQEDHEKWEPKLPKDYKEIILMSNRPEFYFSIKKEELYNIFSEGILLKKDKVLLSFVGNRERNEMVSAATFSYKNSCPVRWQSLPESRFGTVVEMLDTSNLIIEIKTRAQFLSPNVVYGVCLVFKFSRNLSNKPLYVNLKYKNGRESLHAYFATWRDNEWMIIELHRFLHEKEDVVYEFLLESLSSYYCGDGTIYVEGIEFRAINNVKHEEIGKFKEVQQVLKSTINADQVQPLPTKFEEVFKKYGNLDELFWFGEVNGMKLLMLSAKAALYNFSNVDLFTSKPSPQSRFQKVIELLPQKVFHINCTIESQMLSPDTNYTCYLVFNISEKCSGLHYPVKVRDILHQENNDAEFFYFITPSQLNTNAITRVPKPREDGWMEIQLWNFNSTHELRDGSLSINTRFTSLEGPMSGLIVYGLEYRPL